jgi:Rieske Fe-S protein
MHVSCTRREFLKVFAVGAAVSSFGGRKLTQTYASEVMATSIPNTGTFKVTFTEYPVLRNEFSSIRLSVNPMLGDFPWGRFYPILINRAEGEHFYALDSECRHASCVVPAYDEPNGGIICPCHGSVYMIDGTLIEGPSTQNLRSYPISFDGNETLTVEVPGLGYSVAGSVVQDGSRFRLAFRAFQHVEYEVRFRAGLNAVDNWTVVPFSLTGDGPADQQVFTGGNDDEDVAVYVDRTTPAGFYAVAIRMLDVTQG